MESVVAFAESVPVGTTVYLPHALFVRLVDVMRGYATVAIPTRGVEAVRCNGVTFLPCSRRRARCGRA